MVRPGRHHMLVSWNMNTSSSYKPRGLVHTGWVSWCWKVLCTLLHEKIKNLCRKAIPCASQAFDLSFYYTSLQLVGQKDDGQGCDLEARNWANQSSLLHLSLCRKLPFRWLFSSIKITMDRFHKMFPRILGHMRCNQARCYSSFIQTIPSEICLITY